MDQKPFITTNENKLRDKSSPASESEGKDLIGKLLQAIPENGLGLAAPQILEFKRVFIARLSVGTLGFVNPRFSPRGLVAGDTQVPSTESCLSLPNVVRTVTRYKRVKITADYIFSIADYVLPVAFGRYEAKKYLEFQGQDAFIVQHEYDHLEGTLIIDLPEIKSSEDKAAERQQKRKEKIAKSRQERKIKAKQLPALKLSKKTIAKRRLEDQKHKKKMRRKEKDQKIRVKEIERQTIAKLGLFSEQAKPANNDSKDD